MAEYYRLWPFLWPVTVDSGSVVLFKIVDVIPMHLLCRLEVVHFAFGGNGCILEIELHFDGLDLRLLIY